MSKTNKQGFTLIELSIVLVIIGLIVGGVLVGQDLIKAAQIRAAVGQIEKYDAAVNTFRGKYNGLPGDLSNCSSFFSATGDCPTGGVTGNGILEDATGTYVKYTGEVAAFFHHLYLANLIAETNSDTTAINSAIGLALIATGVPPAKIGGGNFVVAYTGDSAATYTGISGVNLYRLTGLTASSGALSNVAPVLTNNLSVIEAFQIDSKKDDGVPNSGGVQGTESAVLNSSSDTATTGATKCRATASTYNTASAPTSKYCNLVIRASF